MGNVPKRQQPDQPAENSRRPQIERKSRTRASVDPKTHRYLYRQGYSIYYN